ncbi:ribonuclease P protein component [Flagellimonas halotolerans]|uniref:Ribonuclease P protein component n=1 Tax=Flagellimonas halotolerans TaxID=3112164 RepID=A0ABU6IL16_9FLAO|nr:MULTISPECIES: ribonuclease P protein component [unclassified Allomuricauda]MEC3963919.1 ribonuclease P protein component [Muricauda sp. SYSU M86414]MEC4263789.1 ribonuclease P protein component [Muricauda sp. SYSU M84420]
MKNKIIPDNPKLKAFAKQLRKHSTLSEVLLWQKTKQRALGVQFHRQVPLLEYIVDFYCHKLLLAIEIDGVSHEFKYDKGAQRGQQLEKVGVHLARLQDSEVKNNMFGVLMTLQEVVSDMQSEKPYSKKEKTPLRPPQGDTSFSKKEKLTNKKMFEALFTEGKNLREFPLKLVYLNTHVKDEVPVKVAVVAPKRQFKSAVDRNRIKRLLREAYRRNKPLIFNNIEGNYAFIFLYLGKKTPSFNEVDAAMKKLLEAFIKKEFHEKID